MTQPNDPVDTFELMASHPGDPPKLRALRFAVIAMGFVLFVGLAAVVARIIYLTMRPASQSVDGVASPSSQPLGNSASGSTIAADINLALPAGAKVRSQSLAGNRLAVHYEVGGLEGILILDLETGRPLSQVRISAGPR
jgi:hypothetical protein